MLSLLGFKRAVFAGVFDGGDPEVLLGGSRLARFMETVEKTTPALRAPSTKPDETAGEGNVEVAADDGLSDARDGAAREAPSLAAKSADQPLASLIEDGLALLSERSRTLHTARGDGRHAFQANGPFQLACDPTTGETLLLVRIPDARVLTRALQAAAGLVESLQLDR